PRRSRTTGGRRRTRAVRGAGTGSVTTAPSCISNAGSRARVLVEQTPGCSKKSSMSDMRDRVVELRQYTLHPGMRDVLIDLFDREFVETQEALGMTVLGQFRDLDDP